MKSGDSQQISPDTERLKRFEDVYKANQEDLFFYIQRSLSDPEPALDILQDTFVNFCNYYAERTLPANDVECRMILYRTARNLLINSYQTFYKTKVSLVPDFQDDGRSAALQPVHRDETVQNLEKKEIRQVLKGLMAGLKEEQREVIILRYDQELTLEEISKIMELSISAISRRLKKAEQALLKESERRNIDLMTFISFTGLMYLWGVGNKN